MILAGDIGATRTRLAAFDTEGNRLQCVVEKTYKSQEHDGLAERATWPWIARVGHRVSRRTPAPHAQGHERGCSSSGAIRATVLTMSENKA